MLRRGNKLDLVINIVDNFLKTNFGGLVGSGRKNPAAGLVASHENGRLNSTSRELSGKLMRINHSGEVAAQGLYQGQLLFETEPTMRNYLKKAAREEADHLMWTEEYLVAKGTKKSFLNPIWYLGSFGLAVFMQLQGQKKSKSFLAETERQVQTHLENHLNIFPSEDNQARVILTKMYEDEGEHANWAENGSSGNDSKEELSRFEKHAMEVMSKVMIETSKRI